MTPPAAPRSLARAALAAAAAVALLASLLAGPPATAAVPVGDPDSTHVLVNKKRPLDPLTYVPRGLVTHPGTGTKLREGTSKALAGLFAAARAKGHRLRVTSGYRSYATQKALYAGYVARYGRTYADRISARPGYSEHQTGLAADIGLATGGCGYLACFGDTAAGKWVAANAYRYGFIVRYPKGYESTTGYTYEPWHLRYVGKRLANEMEVTDAPTLEHHFDGTKPSIPTAVDLVSMGADRTVSNTRPTFTGYLASSKAIAKSTPELEAGFAVDWDADGTQDLLRQGTDGRLLYQRGRASGGFLAATTIGRGLAGQELAVGRLDKASKYPVVVAVGTDGALYRWGRSGGVLTTRTKLAADRGDRLVAFHDWDRDGRQDLLAVRADGSVYAYRGDGAGTLRKASPLRAASGWSGVSGVQGVSGFRSPGTHGLLVERGSTLYYYPASAGALGAPKSLGTAYASRLVFR